MLGGFNREGLGIEVDFSLRSFLVIRTLNNIIEWRGKPLTLRVENSPENISATLQCWAEKHGIAIQCNQPAKKLTTSAKNRSVRQYWLARYIFDTIEEVQDHATQWLWTYNNDRPNMGIGGITTAMKLKFAA